MAIKKQLALVIEFYKSEIEIKSKCNYESDQV